MDFILVNILRHELWGLETQALVAHAFLLSTHDVRKQKQTEMSYGCWRVGSMVQSTGCFCGRLRFEFQQIYDDSY